MVVLKMLETNTDDKTTGAEFQRGQTPCMYHMDDTPIANTGIGRGLIKPVFLVPIDDTAIMSPAQQATPDAQATSI